jgi:hypothetical protein
MNSSSFAKQGHRVCAAALATTTAVAALAVISASAPAANAQRSDSYPQPVTRCVGGLGRACTIDIALEVANRKAALAQYEVDHAAELHPWDVR